MKAGTNIRSYQELVRLSSFEDRFEYLLIGGVVGRETFGFDRFLNQEFYNSKEWRKIRDDVIVRDNGCDLGIEGFTICGPIYIHHMNPILLKDIVYRTDYLLNPDYLICTSRRTHDAIHYGGDPANYEMPVRRPNDTCPWKQ